MKPHVQRKKILRSLRLSLRFVVPLAVALAILAYAVVPLVDKLYLRWFVRDIDIRSKLIASTLQEPLAPTFSSRATSPRSMPCSCCASRMNASLPWLLRQGGEHALPYADLPEGHQLRFLASPDKRGTHASNAPRMAPRRSQSHEH